MIGLSKPELEVISRSDDHTQQNHLRPNAEVISCILDVRFWPIAAHATGSYGSIAVSRAYQNQFLAQRLNTHVFCKRRASSRTLSM